MRTYRYLSEFTVGEKFTTLSRTVTETDVVLFAGITGDMNPIHTDRSYADNLPFHSRIAHGLLGAGIATGLWGRMGLVDGSAIAALSTEWKFVGAIKLGDTIHCEIDPPRYLWGQCGSGNPRWASAPPSRGTAPRLSPCPEENPDPLQSLSYPAPPFSLILRYRPVPREQTLLACSQRDSADSS